MLKVDLHCHSNISDGVLAPAAVAAHAHQAGVNVWALTDHDEVSGTAAARAAALDLGMRFVAGVEISITWAGQTVHIVGLKTIRRCCRACIRRVPGAMRAGARLPASWTWPACLAPMKAR
jgi:predicted metal-dependent phosphoesterase TrpH